MKLKKSPNGSLSVFFIFIIAAAIFTVGINKTHAAPLSYASDTQIYLSTPNIIFTISAGSSADSLTITATSVAVTLSSSTGGSFTLAPASGGLTISTSSSGGTVAVSCTSGVASTTISQTTGATIYTIAPTGSVCVPGVSSPATPAPVANVPSGGGGGGGGSLPAAKPTPIITPTSTPPLVVTPTSTTSSSSSLSNEIAQLEAQLNALLAQTNKQPSSALPGTFNTIFTRDLYFGLTGKDVNALQKFLIAEASGPAATALAEHGATQNFATLTRSALIEFQKKFNITPAVGYFGPLTRAVVNQLIEASSGK